MNELLIAKKLLKKIHECQEKILTKSFPKWAKVRDRVTANENELLKNWKKYNRKKSSHQNEFFNVGIELAKSLEKQREVRCNY